MEFLTSNCLETFNLLSAEGNKRHCVCSLETASLGAVPQLPIRAGLGEAQTHQLFPVKAQHTLREYNLCHPLDSKCQRKIKPQEF